MYAYEQFRNFALVHDSDWDGREAGDGPKIVSSYSIREVAKKMLTKGMALTDICDITGFTKSEVEKLKN